MESPFLKKTTSQLPQYHGGTVRYLFLGSAILLLFNLPIAQPGLPTPFSIIGIVVLVVAAGFTNRLRKSVVIVDALLAGIGFFITESIAVVLYRSGEVGRLFLSNLILSILFLFALYFSIRSIVKLFGANHTGGSV